MQVFWNDIDKNLMKLGARIFMPIVKNLTLLGKCIYSLETVVICRCGSRILERRFNYIPQSLATGKLQAQFKLVAKIRSFFH